MFVIFFSLNKTWPLSDLVNPVIRSNKVDLPAPFGPITPKISPSLTSNVISWN